MGIHNKYKYREEVRALGVWCQENNLATQRQKNKGIDRGLQETAKGACPYLHRRDHSGECGKLQVPRRTHEEGNVSTAASKLGPKD